MARILIVGCGGRGQALARALVEQGHAVRGTTRDRDRFAEIAAAGAEPYLGDPDRIATLMDALAQTTIVAWLMGTAPSEELHAGRLRMLTEKVVDTGVRGLIYEAAGTVDPAWLRSGRVDRPCRPRDLEHSAAGPAHRPGRLRGMDARRG